MAAVAIKDAGCRRDGCHWDLVAARLGGHLNNGAELLMNKKDNEGGGIENGMLILVA